MRIIRSTQLSRPQPNFTTCKFKGMNHFILIRELRKILLQNQHGFSFVEVLVMALLFSIVLAAGSMVFEVGQNVYSVASMKAELKDNAYAALSKISFELQESGRDSGGVLQVNVLDGAGVNGSDILRFSVPLCVCGASPIDSNGQVSRWGAPLQWGQAGCSTTYPLETNGKVKICHYPPGNPNNSNTLSVSVNAVKAHLAHGDTIGECGSCSLTGYTNRKVEYLMSNNQLLRRVLDSTNTVVNSNIVAARFTDFQVSLNVGQTMTSLSLQLQGKALKNRTITLLENLDVVLRNY